MKIGLKGIIVALAMIGFCSGVSFGETEKSLKVAVVDLVKVFNETSQGRTAVSKAQDDIKQKIVDLEAQQKNVLQQAQNLQKEARNSDKV